MITIKRRAKLPRWARQDDAGRVEIDAGVAYPLVLAALGVEAPTQYWLEVARRCVTHRLKETVGAPLHLHIVDPSGAWRLADHPPGPGADAGVAEFRTHYDRLARDGAW